MYMRSFLLFLRKNPKVTALFLILLFSGCVRVHSGQAWGGERIKVLILRSPSSIEIKGAASGTLQIKRESRGSVRVNGRERSLPLKVSPGNGALHINGKPFRGTVEICESKEGLLVINELPIEAYLGGIINNEISSKWHEDVIKSQVIVARTYALFQKNRRAKEQWHVESSIMGQVYSGMNAEDDAAHRAIRETAGEVLTYNGEPALTVYHSNAGGRTDASSDVWSHDYPYLRSVESAYDNKMDWELRLNKDELKSILNKAGYRVVEPEGIYPLTMTQAGRVKVMVIQDSDGNRVKISGEDLRKAVGYPVLKSALFDVVRSGDDFIFRGRGAGHGVGLSQWGAKGMAEGGFSYEKILQHFYPGTELVKIY